MSRDNNVVVDIGTSMLREPKWHGKLRYATLDARWRFGQLTQRETEMLDRLRFAEWLKNEVKWRVHVQKDQRERSA